MSRRWMGVPLWLLGVVLGVAAPGSAEPGRADAVPPEGTHGVAPGESEPRAPRDGDIVFQMSRSRQSAAIEAATGSPYTHMGLVLHDGHRTMVYEAVQPTRRTPWSRFVRRGRGGHYVLMRLRPAHRPKLAEGLQRVREVARSMLGRPYDLLFEWSDRKLYCSEYVWKVYQRALGIEVGAPQRWADLHLEAPAARRLARARLGHAPDAAGRIITPVRMMTSPMLVEVAQNPRPRGR